MTKVELEKEAIEYVCKENPLVIKDWFIEAFKEYDEGKRIKYLKDCEIAEYEAYIAGAEPREKRIEELEAQIEKMNELINRYYEVCVQIPKEYRTMVFDSCLEDTRQLRR